MKQELATTKSSFLSKWRRKSSPEPHEEPQTTNFIEGSSTTRLENWVTPGQVTVTGSRGSDKAEQKSN